ncbi:MAG: hypothetical protein PPP58_00510 [Natronomonas sp.]
MRSNATLVAVGTALLMVVSLVALGAAPAAAVDSETDDLPEEVEVGAETEATFEFDNLFEDFESWTLRGETNMTNVTWTVRQFDAAGNQVRQTSTDGELVEADVDIDDGTDRVEVRVIGDAPEIESFRYDPPEEFRYAEFTLVRGGGTEQAISDYRVHHFTTESSEARAAIDAAAEAVEGSGSSDAESSLQSAISAYEAGNFGNAIELAERAQSEADRASLLRTGLLVGGVAVVVLLLAGGGLYAYRSRQQEPERLR